MQTSTKAFTASKPVSIIWFEVTKIENEETGNISEFTNSIQMFPKWRFFQEKNKKKSHSSKLFFRTLMSVINSLGCSGESVGLSLLFIPDWGLSCISGRERASEYVTTAYTRILRNSKHSATDSAIAFANKQVIKHRYLEPAPDLQGIRTVTVRNHQNHTVPRTFWRKCYPAKRKKLSSSFLFLSENEFYFPVMELRIQKTDHCQHGPRKQCRE